MRLHPKDITLEWSVPKRTGKIFMDYNMNVRGKTLNVALLAAVPRARRCLCRSAGRSSRMPTRSTFDHQRLGTDRGDQWKDVLERKQSLSGR